MPAARQATHAGWLFGILATAFCVRLAWAYIQNSRGYTHAAGEAYNVSVAIAQGRGISDAYYVGQGATAHLTPVTPVIAGYIYKVLGISSSSAELVLFTLATCVVLYTYYLLFQAFDHLSVSRLSCFASLIFLAVSPLYLTIEAVDFRVWDGALVTLVAAWLLYCLAKAESTGIGGTKETRIIACVLAILLFLNPNLGIAGGVATIILMLRRYDPRRAVSLILKTAFFLMVLMVPWTVRNYEQLGAFIPLRSNAGIELSIANYDGAINIADPALSYRNRLAAIHPFTSKTAAAAMQKRGGEVAYSRYLGKEAKSWIIHHPGDFLYLYIRHVSQFFAPRPWQFSLFGGGSTQSVIRSVISLLLTVGAFSALILAYRRRDYVWLFPACFLLTPALIYGVFQPVPRYTYLIYGLSVFMAADGYTRLLRSFAAIVKRRSGNPPRMADQSHT